MERKESISEEGENLEFRPAKVELHNQQQKRQDCSREDAILNFEDQLKKVELENQHLKQYKKQLEDTHL